MPTRETNKVYYRDYQAKIEKREDGSIESISLSSDNPVSMPYGTEILDHSEGAINFERSVNGLPFLWRHNSDQVIGRIKDIRVEKGKMRGDPVFSANTIGQEKKRDVDDEILIDISIGYTVQRWEETDDLIIAREWTPYEASLLPIPADPSVGFGREASTSTNKGAAMPKENDTTQNSGGTTTQNSGGTTGAPVLDFTNARELAIQEGRAEGQRLERERLDGIRALFVPESFHGPAFDQLKETAISSGWDLEKTRQALLDLVGTGVTPTTDPGQADRRHSIERGADEYDKFREAAELSLMVRSGTLKDKDKIAEARKTGLVGFTLMELSREYLRMNNVNTFGMGRRELAGQVFVRSLIAHSTSDFVNILANVAHKNALVGWTEAPETWSVWTRIGSLSDFKTADRSGLGEFPDLDLIKENGEYRFATMSDRKEQIQLATYGKGFSISRQAIINDDLNEFSTVPRKMGRAASRKIGDVCYAVLTSNPTLNQDSTTLFHSSHSNLGTAGAPSVTTYNEMFKLMGLQKDNDDHATGLNIQPAFVLGPLALRASINELNDNQYDPAATAGTLKKNPYNGLMQPVFDARLDADSSTAWYGLADPYLNDTIEVAFLDGEQEPYIEQEQGFDTDGVKMKVRIDAVAGALGYQGAFKNAGA